MTVQYLPQDPDNKAIRELRDELKDLNSTLKKNIKTNEVFSVILMVVGFLQLLIAILQLSAAIYGNNLKGTIFAIIAELILFGIIFYFINKTVKDQEKDIK